MIRFNKGNVDYNILLASASPRRQDLLREIGLKFKLVKAPLAEEIIPKDLFRENIAVHLAKEKADSYLNLAENDLLITADTIVWVDGKVLGKPVDYSDAFQMLKLLSNRSHSVITGVCLKSLDKTVCFHAESLVRFAKMNDEEIRYYIENYKPYDKAGAYGIQEWIGKIGVEHIEGSYYNVVGLPVQMVYQELKQF